MKRLIIQFQEEFKDLDCSNPLQKDKVNCRIPTCPPEYARYRNRHFVDLHTLPYQEYLKAKDCYPLVVQAKGSALPATLLLRNLDRLLGKDQPYSVLDCTAAPGNKTLQLCAYTPDEVTVYAFDKDPARFKTLKERVSEFGYNNKARLYCQDVMQYDLTRLEGVKLVLADPSCSGSGMLANQFIPAPGNKGDPFIAFQSLSEDKKTRVFRLAQFQLSLLRRVADQVRPVRLSYSTCSIFWEENQSVVEQFLALHPEYRLETLRKDLPDGVKQGLGETGRKCLRVSPGSTDGFFLAILRQRFYSKPNVT